MAEERDGQERSEQATPKRVEEARRQGQVVRSRELTSMLLLLGSGGVLLLVGERLGRGMADLMRQLFTLSTRNSLASMSLQQVLIDGLWSALVSVMPLLSACALISLLAPIAVGGWNWSSEALAPKWNRLDPLAGVMRMFSSQSLVEAAKSALKLLLVLLALGALLWTNLGDLMALEHMDAQRSFSTAIRLTLHSFLFLAATTVVSAFLDVPWQLFSHA